MHTTGSLATFGLISPHLVVKNHPIVHSGLEFKTLNARKRLDILQYLTAVLP